MSVKDVLVHAKQCVCQLCSHDWVSFSEDLPVICPGCKSRKWNGAKKRGPRRDFNIAKPKGK